EECIRSRLHRRAQRMRDEVDRGQYARVDATVLQSRGGLRRAVLAEHGFQAVLSDLSALPARVVVHIDLARLERNADVHLFLGGRGWVRDRHELAVGSAQGLSASCSHLYCVYE